MNSLKGKVAVVTGGARDIGRAVSIKLAKEGAKVVVNYFDSIEDGKTTSKLIEEASEVADLVAYLASDESSFISGNNIDINGGLAFS